MRSMTEPSGWSWRSAISLLVLLCFGLSLQADEQPIDYASAFKAVLAGEAEQDFKLGLALGAGSAKGLAHIGMLRALEEAGLRVDMVAGSSMGSVIGAGIALGFDSRELATIAMGKDARDVIRLLDPVLFSEGLIDGERIRLFLESVYGQRKIEELPMPYMATATNISTGQLYYLDSGDLSLALRTSVSIPVIFTPVRMDSLILIDGGFAEPVPVSATRELGADFIIAVNVLVPPIQLPDEDSIEHLNADDLNRESPPFFKPRGYRKESGDHMRLLQILQSTYHITAGQVARSRMIMESPDLIIELASGIQAWEFLKAETAIENGYEITRAILDAYREGNELPPEGIVP